MSFYEPDDWDPYEEEKVPDKAGKKTPTTSAGAAATSRPKNKTPPAAVKMSAVAKPFVPTSVPGTEQAAVAAAEKQKGKKRNRKRKKKTAGAAATPLQPAQVVRPGKKGAKQKEEIDPLGIMGKAVAKVKGLPLFSLSPALEAVAGPSPLTRTAAVTQLWAYIKANGLQTKVEGKLGVACDEKLKALFQQDTILASKMTKALRKHFLEKKGYAPDAKKPAQKKKAAAAAAPAPATAGITTGKTKLSAVGKKPDAEGSGTASTSTSRGKAGKKKKKKKWWKTMVDDIDPISLEPLGHLSYPPFELVGKDHHSHYFDGQCLASYMVSTSQFLNPLSREALSSRDCQRLDAYLRANNLKPLRVNDAFNIASAMVETAQDGNANATARALQREAAAVMSSMFLHRRIRGQSADGDRSASGTSHAGQPYARVREQVQGGTGAGGGGVRVFDDDAWIRAAPFDLQGDFPTMGGPAENGAETAPTWGIMAGAGQVPIMRSAAEFPEMPAAGPPPRPTATTAWGTTAPAPLPTPTPKAKEDGMWARGVGLDSVKKGGAEDDGKGPTIFARPARLRLNLKKRSAAPTTQEKDLFPEGRSGAAAPEPRPSSAPVNIFGEARPREVMLSARSEDAGAPGAAYYGGAAPPRSGYADEQYGNFLCPYSPWSLSVGRSMGQRWLCQLESTLRSFVHQGAGVKVMQPALPPMPLRQRAFVHDYCQNHWGFSTSSVDPHPNRRVQVFKSGEPSIPYLPLSRAVLVYSEDLCRGVAVEDRPPRDWEVTAGRVGVWNLRGPGGTRVTQQQVHDLLSRNCRRSEYTVNWVHGDSNVVVEFASSKRAKKAFATILAMKGKNGPVAWKACQWWPAPISWAAKQLRIAEAAEKHARVVEKERRKKEAALRRMEQERREIEAKARGGKPAKDGWFDSDEEADEGSSSSSEETDDGEVEQQKLRLGLEREGRAMRKAAKKVGNPVKYTTQRMVDLPSNDNLWEALLSDSEDEDDLEEQQRRGTREGERWWAELQDVDPISLEPLSLLVHPPFKLVGKDGHLHYMDGFSLASYMVSANQFINPMSREPVEWEDCERLDNYLWKNGLKGLRVKDAFELRNEAETSPVAQMLQRTAQGVMNSVFSSARNQAKPSSSKGSRKKVPVRRSNPYMNHEMRPEEKYARQLQQLRAMGLTDNAKNLACLVSFEGDVNQAVEALMG